jgi:hypothetical protein
VTAEYHKAEAPALASGQNAERKKQSARAGNAMDICRCRPQGAEDIALLAIHGKRQDGESC